MQARGGNGFSGNGESGVDGIQQRAYDIENKPVAVTGKSIWETSVKTAGGLAKSIGMAWNRSR